MAQIDSAKDTLALQEGLGDFSEVSVDAVNEILGRDMQSSCPDGGVIQYNPIGVSPSCSVHGTLYQLLETVEELTMRTATATGLSPGRNRPSRQRHRAGQER